MSEPAPVDPRRILSGQSITSHVAPAPVVTERLVGESEFAWQARHARAIAAVRRGRRAPPIVVPQISDEEDPLHDEWFSGGVLHEVDTTRNVGEGIDEWRARHAAAVAFWQGVYPPDQDVELAPQGRLPRAQRAAKPAPLPDHAAALRDLRSSTPGWRTTELWAPVLGGGGTIGAVLLPLLKDPDPKVRIAACLAIAVVAGGFAIGYPLARGLSKARIGR